MTGLISRRAVSAALAIARSDHCRQAPSPPRTSRSTLLSTRTSLTAREGHDLVGCHRYVATMSSHVFNQSFSAVQAFLAPRTADADVLAVEIEIDLRVRHEAGLFPNRDRDGDLALGGDAHGINPISYLLK